ncbi:MAG: glycoside hydrolase [Candidatus Eremiobacterales bacterium]
MSEPRPLDVVLCWHMHQPQYRRASSGEFQLPWTYLHAIKDYADMAWHLEQNGDARAVVNLTPVLLDQIEDYAGQFARRAFRDPLLRALADPESVPSDDLARLIEACFRANAERMIRRHAPYQRLRDAYDSARTGGFHGYLSTRFLTDVCVWYHLAWLGESIAREDARAIRLQEKATDFDETDRSDLIDLMGEVVRGIIGRYRALAANGRVELSTSPYTHPILPLLIDFIVARESQPDASLPHAPEYPGGVARAQAHVRAAIASHAGRFGKRPAGCWPSEGAISKASLSLLASSGFAWGASCETVLVRSLGAAGADLPPREAILYKPYVVGDASGRGIAMFFRDVRLSDLIGFRYADWHADDAIANFVGELEGIARSTAEHDAPIVSIILDGENAWEHYPENGFYFLSGLYRALSSHASLRLTTFSEHLVRNAPASRLDTLVAGSWVYGTLSTWIGEPAKNRAWDLLVAAKTDFDGAVAAGSLTGERLALVEAQLKVCEGSDWFWWFGDENPARTVSDYDRLFRDHIADLYRLMGVEAPASVGAVIGVGVGSPEHGGSMRANPATSSDGIHP